MTGENEVNLVRPNTPPNTSVGEYIALNSLSLEITEWEDMSALRGGPESLPVLSSHQKVSEWLENIPFPPYSTGIGSSLKRKSESTTSEEENTAVEDGSGSSSWSAFNRV